MSLPHAKPGEMIEIRPLGPRLTETASTALVRTADIEVMRMVLPKGKSIPEHHVPGGLTIQCLEGTVELQVEDDPLIMQTGQLIYIAAHASYALRALEDSSLLTTIVRKPQNDRA